MSNMNVIDLAYCNRVTDWDKVKQACDFVILRAGYGGESNQKDARFESHYKGAHSVGLNTLAYHYSYAKTVARARVEAKTCLAWLKGKTIPIVFFDIEDQSQERLSKKQLTDLCIAFCEVIEKAGYRAGIYASKYWWTEKLDHSRLKNCLVWVAQYYKTCTFAHHYDLWQYSENGKVDGITGGVDLNYCDTDLFEQQEKPSTPVRKKTSDGAAIFSMKQDGANFKLSKHFSLHEMQSKDGADRVLVHPDLIKVLQAVRDSSGKPLVINSGYRTTSHNKRVGGVSNSTHTKGMAADTWFSGDALHPSLLAKFYEVAGAKCIIYYPEKGMVHTDCRKSKYYSVNDYGSKNTFLITVRNGSRGQDVKDLQTMLNLRANAKLSTDGIFGSGTLAAVQKYQKAHKLSTDGICGKNTWTSLLT